MDFTTCFTCSVTQTAAAVTRVSTGGFTTRQSPVAAIGDWRLATGRQQVSLGRIQGSGSGELLGGLVEPVHHRVHRAHRLDHVIERLVPET